MQHVSELISNAPREATASTVLGRDGTTLRFSCDHVTRKRCCGARVLVLSQKTTVPSYRDVHELTALTWACPGRYVRNMTVGASRRPANPLRVASDPACACYEAAQTWTQSVAQYLRSYPAASLSRTCLPQGSTLAACFGAFESNAGAMSASLDRINRFPF